MNNCVCNAFFKSCHSLPSAASVPSLELVAMGMCRNGGLDASVDWYACTLPSVVVQLALTAAALSSPTTCTTVVLSSYEAI